MHVPGDCSICKQCGTQFAPSAGPPANCAICEDERQFVNPAGQQWTTAAELACTHRNVVATEGPNVIGVGMTPEFAIGQRALLVRGEKGIVMWDCIPLLDASVADMIGSLGGLRAIAISHPHFHAAMVDWAQAFDCPVYIHAANERWVMRHDNSICFWNGDTHDLGDGFSLIHCGGHFPGSTVLHSARNGGALFTGDTFYVNPDRATVGWMYSFPNHIPLSAAAVQRAASALDPFSFERVYSAWWKAVIVTDGKNAIRRSATRYVAAINRRYDS